MEARTCCRPGPWRSRFVRRQGILFAIIAAAASSAVRVVAQEPVGGASASGASRVEPRQSNRGFLFRAPRGTLGLRAGFNIARAGSGVFDLATQEFTLEQSDFSSFMVAAELGINVHGPIDVVMGAGYANSSTPSESREYEDQDGLPITQRTTFQQIPFSLLARVYLTPQGRRIGRFAWVPAKFSPYVGMGAAYTHYLFRQTGSFVDYVDLSIFDDTFEASGWAPLGIVNAGADLSVHPNVVLNTDIRYQFGSGDLTSKFEQDFVGFTDGLDLTGFQLAMGVRFRF